MNVDGTVTADGLTVNGSAATISSSGANVDLVLTEGSTNTDARIRNSNGILEIDADLNNEFGSSYIMLAVDGADKLKVDRTGDISFYEDTGTTAKFFWDASAESLGIGTTSPAYKIDSNGSVRAYSSTFGDSDVIAETTAATGTGYSRLILKTTDREWRVINDASTSGSPLLIYDATAATERMRIDSNGNTLLQTGGAALQWQNGYQTITGDAASNNLTYRTYANHIWKTTTGASSTTDGTERMRIDSSGNVGIGTSSPATPLDVTTAGGGNFVATFQNTTAATPYGVSIKEPASAANGYPSFQITDSTGTNVRLRVDSGTGNVGIGTSSILSKLHVAADATYQQYITGTDINQQLRIGYDTTNDVGKLQAVKVGTAYKDLILQPEGGNVGIGRSNPGVRLSVAGSSDSWQLALSTNSSTSGAVIGSPGADVLAFANWAGTERARIDASGVLLVGATAADGIGGAPGDINNAEIGKGYINLNRDDTATARQIQFGKNGVVAGYIETGSSTTSYVTSSDARLKENIADAKSASELIDAIKVRQFDWKADGSHQRYGMVAQELLEVAPEAVSQPEDPEAMMGVDYSKLVPMLVKEIQSLRARVAQLEGA